MKTKLFLEYLPWLRHPDAKIEALGLGKDIQDIFIKNTTPIPRNSKAIFEGAPEKLQELFEWHDLSNIHMLWTFFWAEPQKLLEGWGFADMSETNIVVAPSGYIEAYNAHPIRAIHGESQFLGVLAKDLESYLEAMLCGQMNISHFSEGSPQDDPLVRAKVEPIAQLCTTIAGGDEYYDFWAGLLGL